MSLELLENIVKNTEEQIKRKINPLPIGAAPLKIYIIINLINHKIYIGQTKQDLQTRFKQHCSNYTKTYISSAINFYGKENFIIKQIDSAYSLYESNILEKFWISYYKQILKFELYNLTEGGYNHCLTDEIKQKMIKTTKNNFYKSKNRTSIYKGVYFHSYRKKWLVNIIINGKKTYINQFDKEIEAAISYNEACDKYWGIGVGYRNTIGVKS